MIKIGKKFDDNADINVTYQTYKADYLRPTGGQMVASNKANNQFNTGSKDNSKLNIVYSKMSDKVTNQLALYRNKHDFLMKLPRKNPGKTNAKNSTLCFHRTTVLLYGFE